MTYRAVCLEARYGSAAFTDAFEVRENEVVLVGISQFRDREHHEEVMAMVDSDERIDKLFAQVTALLDLSRILRGEFEQAV